VHVFGSSHVSLVGANSPPLPEGWEDIVQRRVPIARRLTPKESRTLIERMKVFLATKRFEGCGGLEVTDEMRVTIAGNACLLLVGLEGDVFPNVQTILVYPHAYKAVTHERVGPVTIEREQARAGEAWGARGPLVLAWDNVERASTVSEHNVVVHEFAHALDSENGDMDGAPVLPSRERAQAWADVLGEEFRALQEAVRHGTDGDIDPYGATNPAEFFAVVTEAFFGTPELLAHGHPALYAELAAFYGLDGYGALVSSRRRAVPRAPEHHGRLRRAATTYGLLAAMCVTFVVLRFAWIEVFGYRTAGVVEGTVTASPAEVAGTGGTHVRLDTGPEVQVGGAVGDYPAGTRVSVQIRRSPVLGRKSYVFALARMSGPAFDGDSAHGSSSPQPF
jgi:MtfA peptidase